MNKKILFITFLIFMLTLCGCGKTNYPVLPDEPIAFEMGAFEDPRVKPHKRLGRTPQTDVECFLVQSLHLTIERNMKSLFKLLTKETTKRRIYKDYWM